MWPIVSHTCTGHGCASRHAANAANTASNPMPESKGNSGIARSSHQAQTSTATLCPAIAHNRSHASVRVNANGPMRERGEWRRGGMADIGRHATRLQADRME
jgi:hypothetical protein